ncbi:MAG TPA: VOC family protein [Acidimicrobiales bacterium]|nr:VOC family protein [Acidimicrobiales bacterium]
MPYNRVAFTGVAHLSFSVRDLLITVGWYRAVLGLQEIDFVEGDGWKGVLMIHAPSSTMLQLHQHDANQGESFDPRRTGFDHLALRVETREALEDWQEHFIRLSVDHTPIADGEHGSALTFRDPDGIQLEMFHGGNAP